MGQSVLVEKPFTLDVGVLDEVDDKAARKGSWLGVVTNYLCRPDLRSTINMIREGRIGKPLWARLHTVSDGHWVGVSSDDPDWRARPTDLPGGVVADKGYHLLYLAEALCQAPVRDCQWRTAAVRNLGTIDTWSANTRPRGWRHLLAGGELGSAWTCDRRARVHGTAGSVYIDPTLTIPPRVVRDDGQPIEAVSAGEDPWGYGECSRQPPKRAHRRAA